VAGLTLADVRFWYPATERPALDGVSLAVAPGDVVAVIGAVGAGASTLLLVAGNLAPRLTGGRLEGSVRTAPSGIVLPTPWTQASGMAFSVWDEVAFGPANLGVPRDEIARRVDRWLARLEVAQLAGSEVPRGPVPGRRLQFGGLVIGDLEVDEGAAVGSDEVVGHES